MNMKDPKNQQKSIPICSPEQNYLSLFAMRYPVIDSTEYIKWLSNFEFWLELAWLGENCKGKTLLVIEIFFTLHRYSTVTAQNQCAQYPKQNMIKFSQCLAELAQNSNFFKLAVLPSDSMKLCFQAIWAAKAVMKFFAKQC